MIASLRDAGFLAAGPHSPTPGAPYSYATTPYFLSAFGLETPVDLPDLERLEDGGLLSWQATGADDDASGKGAGPTGKHQTTESRGCRLGRREPCRCVPCPRLDSALIGAVREI